VTRTDEHGQPIGDAVPGWSAPPPPAPVGLEGRWVRLEPLAGTHAADLLAETAAPAHEPLWTYSADERPTSMQALSAYVDRRVARPDLVTLVVVPRRTGRASGLASWMRADPANGAVEVGSILLGPALQRTSAATEAMYLMARHVFELGYRRYEWKCDSLNAPSRAAAARLGFTYEGTFRQAVVYKGRNRDTAWFSMTDREWQVLEPAFTTWLDPANFTDPETAEGQRRPLSALTAEALRTAT
jgi:RimJ/RimL family protein N-acetyltransferase